MNVVQVFASIATVVWNTHFQVSWTVQEKVCSMKWGTAGLEAKEEDRPAFRGEVKTIGSVSRSPVNNQPIQYYPKWKRQLQQVISYFVIFLCIVLLLVFVTLEFFVQYDYRDHLFGKMFMIIIAAQIPMISFLYTYVALYFNDLENHQTDTNYLDALTAKTLCFQFFNQYAAVLFTIFGKGPLFGDCIADNCMTDLLYLFFCIFSVRFIILFWKTLIPIVYDIFSTVRKQVQEEEEDGEELELLKTFQDPDDKLFLNELEKDIYAGTFDEYSAVCTQHGFTVLFGPAIYFIPVASLVENLLRIRATAFDLCSCRRPAVVQIADVGLWSNLIDFLSVIGCVTNVALIVLNNPLLTPYWKAVALLVGSQILLMLRSFYMTNVLSVEPDWITDIADRQAYVTKKFGEGYSGDVDEQEERKGDLNDPLDIDRYALYDYRKEKLNDTKYKEIELLEERARDFQRELRLVKERLLIVYKTETFNEITGVGETKHGLPLGRLSIKLLEIQKYDEEVKPEHINVRVNIQAHRRGGIAAGPPISDDSFSKESFVNNDGLARFDQNMGPYAPIRTLDADVEFDVVDVSENANNAILAMASIKLRELQDQQTQMKTLNLRIKADDDDENEANARFARLMVSMKFEYSQVMPLRTRIYHIQDRLRVVERALHNLKFGIEENNRNEDL